METYYIQIYDDFRSAFYLFRYNASFARICGQFDIYSTYVTGIVDCRVSGAEIDWLCPCLLLLTLYDSIHIHRVIRNFTTSIHYVAHFMSPMKKISWALVINKIAIKLTETQYHHCRSYLPTTYIHTAYRQCDINNTNKTKQRMRRIKTVIISMLRPSARPTWTWTHTLNKRPQNNKKRPNHPIWLPRITFNKNSSLIIIMSGYLSNFHCYAWFLLQNLNYGLNWRLLSIFMNCMNCQMTVV